jgi:hypothetical protein
MRSLSIRSQHQTALNTGSPAHFTVWAKCRPIGGNRLGSRGHHSIAATLASTVVHCRGETGHVRSRPCHRWLAGGFSAWHRGGRVGARTVLHCRPRPRRAAPPPADTLVSPPIAGPLVMSSPARHWVWDGNNRDWEPAHYVQRPAPTAVWETGQWLQEPSGGYVWIDGHWRG